MKNEYRGLTKITLQVILEVIAIFKVDHVGNSV